METQKYTFVGWIDKIGAVNKYGRDVYVRTLKDEVGEKFPQKIMFSVSVKNLDKIDETQHCKNAKVSIVFVPFLQQGVSKTNKAYSINKMMLQSITLIEAAPVGEDGEEVEEDMPF